MGTGGGGGGGYGDCMVKAEDVREWTSFELATRASGELAWAWVTWRQVGLGQRTCIRIEWGTPVTGTVRTDKDFGAGYAYKVLIEDATLQP